MRPCLVICCFAIFVASTATIHSQTADPSASQGLSQSASPAGKAFTSLTFSGTAEWFAGSTYETGNAEFSANADGSSSMRLSLGKSSRTETQTGSGTTRTCQWTDAAGKTTPIRGLNCLVPIPWFAPVLFSQPTSEFPAMLSVTDDGQVMRDKAALHQISYRLGLQRKDASLTKRLQDGSAVKVLFDPATALPSSLEYAIHPDGNDLRSIPVRVMFSDYRPVAGTMLPFHIERYVQNSLQLKLDVSNATIE